MFILHTFGCEHAIEAVIKRPVFDLKRLTLNAIDLNSFIETRINIRTKVQHE